MACGGGRSIKRYPADASLIDGRPLTFSALFAHRDDICPAIYRQANEGSGSIKRFRRVENDARNCRVRRRLG
jgi:hypothetical protein